MQRLDDLLGDLLLLLQALLARLRFFAPELELLVHGLEVIRDELYAATQRLRAPREHLDGRLHERDVLLGEAAKLALFFVQVLEHVGALLLGSLIVDVLLFLVSRSCAALLLTLAEATHFDLRTGFIFGGSRLIIIAVSHETLGFLDEGTAPGVHISLVVFLHAVHVHAVVLFLSVLAVSHELLLAESLLLLKHSLLLGLLLHAHLLLLLLALLFKNALLLELLTLHLFLFHLLLTSLLFLGATLLFGSVLLLARGSLGLSLLASSLFGFCLGLSGTVVLLLLTFITAVGSENLRNVGCAINSGGSGSKHLLQPGVGLLRLLTGEHHGRLDVNLLLNHELSERDGLHEPCQLGFLAVSERLRIQLFTIVETIAEARLRHGRSEDVVQITERRLRKQFLVHLRFRKELLIQSSLQMKICLLIQMLS